MGTKVAVGSHVWLPSEDPEIIWIDGELTQIQGQDATVVLTNGKTVQAKLDTMHMKDTELPKDGIEDMTRLSYLHEPGVLDNLKIRYYNNEIYTYVGGILIAINPFQRLAHLEGQEVMNRYRGRNLGELPPHVFAVGDVVYRAMMNERRSNSVLVSGESGAGKTEATKSLMRYLAYLGGTTGGGGRTVEEKVLESNPVLEAFGNAKTLRNNNSSRFGKFVEIQFDERGKICGAAVRTYLLERSRICQSTSPERSYHIFYFLCAAPPEHKAKYKVGDPRQYHYLNQSDCFQVDRIDDHQEYLDLKKAMDVVGMSEDEQDSIFSTVAAILHLGNINFVKGKEPDSSELKDKASRDHLNTVAELLKCDVANLELALISKKIVTRDETIDRALDPSGAVVSRDGLAKQLYSRLFDWLVEKINVSIGQDPTSKLMIGVLDIYGFESFKINSFEQLCINFTNEKLQQHFNQHVFKGEQAEYDKEQIDWSYIEFTDNQDILDLIEKKGGVLSLLDEACVVPRGSHETFCSKLGASFKGHKRFSVPRLARNNFTISHFAGDVQYDSTYFLEKNKDFVVPEQNELLNLSQSPFVSGLFPITEASKSAKFSSIGTRFKLQLQQLMEILNTTDPHYVRCVKPNTKLKPSIFENAPIIQQLQCGGVLEAIRISCQGFPTRRTFAEFVKRFTVLAPSLIAGVEEKEACRKLLDIAGLKGYQIGKTKVFLKAGQMAELDARRTEVLGRAATKIERKWKTYITRKNYLEEKEKATFIETICRGVLARSKFEHMRRVDASIKVQKYRRRHVTRKSYKKQVSDAITIQAGLRGLSARMELDFRRKKRAATKLQARWRGKRKYTSYQIQRKAAITFQSWWRRRLAKKELTRLKIIAKEQKAEQARLAKELEAVKAKMEADRIKLELERMQAERERAEREAAAAAAAAAAEKERKEQEEKERKEREEREEKEKKEREEREARERQERDEREARERKEREEKEARERKEREEKEARERKEREEKEAREKKEREEREAREKKEREEREAREAIAAAAAAAAAAIAAAEAMKSEKIDELAAEQEQLKAKLEEESKEKESIMNAKAELLQKLEELKDTIKRLEEDASSTEALLKTEKQEHDATKNALASKTEELAKHIEATDKRIEQLQEEVKDAKQNSAAKEELLAERQGHEASKKSLAESQDKNKDLEKRIEDAESKIVQLKKDLERSEENTREKEALLQTEKQEHKATQNALSEENQAHHKTKKALEEETEEHDSAKKSLHKEKQEHDLTKQALAEEKLEHDFAKKSLAQEKQEHNSTKNALEKEKQEHEDTNNAFAKEKREHDSTKDSLSESHRKNKELQNDVEDANKKTSAIQLDLQRSKEEMASTEAMLRTERQEHDTTKRTLVSSQQKNDELSRKMEDTDKRIVDLQGNVHRLEDDKSRKESMLENERLEHDTTKRKFAEYQDKNDELMRKTQGAEQRIIELQIEVKRYQEEAGSKEVTLQREKQEHKATKEELAELQANNKRLVREADDATDKCDRLQRNMSRLEETINAKDTFLQKKEDEQNATKESLKESHEKNEGLIQNIKDANKKIDQLQENIQRLEEIIASKEAMFQKERQDHDVTKKLCEEYQERIDELIEKLRDANKKIDRLQDNIERLEEAKSSKETLLQAKQQEIDATEILLTEYQEKIEELEKIIKDANKKIERLQDNIERLQETTSSKDVLLQTERQDHDSTKKSLLESHDKNEELMDKTKDANKRADRLQDNVERLQETITSKDTLLQTEKQEHDRTRKLFKESKDKIDELTDDIRDANKRYDRLQDNVERLEEAKASKEALLQTKQQELDTTKKLLVESEEKIEEFEKKIKEANKKFDGLQEDIKRLDETIASKETLLETERQEHETTKKLLKESNNKHEEFMDKIKEANKRADRIQDNVERLGETIALKDTLLQTEKQEHEETKKLLKDLKEKNEELLEQIKDINKQIDRHQDAIQRLEETIATKEAVVQAERLEHDATKKLLKESKEKYEEISEKTRDADKKCDRLQDKIERLEETITSKDTILQTERQEHDATKKLLKGSQEEIEELGKQIRDYNKKIDRLQDNMERLQESTTLKETSLQKERQELEATKKSLKESQDENDALAKKLRESNKNLDRLQDNAERLEELKASKEALLQTERQEHDTAKKLLNESRDKIEELELKSKDANKKASQLQDDIQRLEDIIAGKEESLQSERQEHDTTRKSLKRSQDEYNELLKQIDENRERVNQLHNEMQRLRENEIGKEALLQTEQRLHEVTKRELTDSKDKMKELLEKVESTDQRYGQLQLELKRLEENAISKDSLVQIEKREHEATQRALAQSKDYSDELLKRNEVSNNRIDRLQEDIARFEAKVKEMQEEVLKGRLDIYDAKRQSGDNKDLLIKIEDANRNIYQLQDNLRRMEENARENETTLLTEKQQHDRAKKSLASAQVKIEQLEKQISQLQDGPGRVEQGGMANIQSERIQHDATKQAFAESQNRNQELLYKLESSERKIEQLQQDIKRLQENQYAASNRGFTGQPGRNDDYMRADQSYENIQTTQKREAEKFSRQQSFIPSSLLYADDDIRKAYAAAQKRSEELVTQLDEAEKTIDHLQETINILEDKAYNLEQENKMLRQTAVNPTPHLRTQQKTPENGYGVPNTPQSIPRNPMSNTNRDYMEPEEREQNPQLEKQQLESLIKSISRHLGFVQGSPVAANLIYKCLVQWKSFESDKTGAFERIIQTIITATKEVQDDKEPLAYWLSNLSTLVLLLQKTQKYGGGPTASSTQRRFRRAPRGSSVGPFASNMGGGANDAINFTQKVTAQLEKLFGALKEKLKSDISPLLNLCVQAPKVSRMTSMKGVGLSALGSASPSIVQWQTIVKVLNEYMALLKTNYVPHFVIQKLFTETFKIIDVQLFNGLVLRRECCSLSNGEFVKAGLEELERWCRDATDEYVGSTWKELGHIRQAVDFLVMPQKQSKTLSEITNDICHSLTISQIHRLSNLYWDDKYGTNVLSQEATSEMSQIISREPNNTFMLEEDYSNNFSSEELSRSISVVELRDTDLPPQIRNHAGFAFFLQRNY